MYFDKGKQKKNLAFHSSLIIHQRRFTMLQKMTRTNEKGFTLIELMIVIAIIGILAAIAIPNFISYRNKSFCSAAESDGNGIAAAISDYFAIPSHTATPALTDLNSGKGYRLSGNPINTAAVAGANPNLTITITVVDSSTRCPTDYQAGMTVARSPKGFWTTGTYTKLIAF
jgi:prepilin-type N-terminal cleavage/methylation domain-containing protein